MNYLEVSTNIKEMHELRAIYDKRDRFDFDTSKILHLSSNVGISVFRNNFLNGIKVFTMLNSNNSDKIVGIFYMYHKTLSHGYSLYFLSNLPVILLEIR